MRESIEKYNPAKSAKKAKIIPTVIDEDFNLDVIIYGHVNPTEEEKNNFDKFVEAFNTKKKGENND